MLIPSRPMADDKPLNDNQVHDRLHAAMEALGNAEGETVIEAAEGVGVAAVGAIP